MLFDIFKSCHYFQYFNLHVLSTLEDSHLLLKDLRECSAPVIKININRNHLRLALELCAKHNFQIQNRTLIIQALDMLMLPHNSILRINQTINIKLAPLYSKSRKQVCENILLIFQSLLFFCHQNKEFNRIHHAISALKQIIEFLMQIHIEKLDTNKALQIQIKNIHDIIKFCNASLIDQKLLVKALLFQKFDIECKVINPYTLQLCEQNLKSTAYVIINLAYRLFCQTLSGLVSVCHLPKEFVIECNINKQTQKQTKLSKLLIPPSLTQSMAMTKQEQSQISNYEICIKVCQNRTAQKYAECINATKISKQYACGLRLKYFSLTYLKVKTFVQRRQRHLTSRILKKMCSMIVAKMAVCNILENVDTSIYLKQTSNQLCNIIQTYVSAFRDRLGLRNQKQRLFARHITRYIRGFQQYKKYINSQQIHLLPLRQLQNAIRSYLIRRRIINQNWRLFQKLNQSNFSHQTQDLKDFNKVINKNRVSQGKAIYIELEVIAINNLSMCPIFSIASLSKLGHGLENNQKIENMVVKQSVVILKTTKKELIYGIQSQHHNSKYSSNAYGLPEEGLKCNLDTCNLLDHSRLQIVQVSCGLNYIVCLSKLNQVYSSGENKYGELGLGDFLPRTKLSKIGGLEQVIKISCGIKQSACLTRAGQVYSWGYIKNHKSNQKQFECRPRLQKCPEGNIIDIECTNYNCFVLYDNKRMFEINNNSICFKEDNADLYPFEILCLRSKTLEIVIIKKLNFRNVTVSLKERKDILKNVKSLNNKQNLFKVQVKQKQYIGLFCESNLCPSQADAAKQNDLNQTNLISIKPENSLDLSISDLDVTFNYQ